MKVEGGVLWKGRGIKVGQVAGQEREMGREKRKMSLLSYGIRF